MSFKVLLLHIKICAVLLLFSPLCMANTTAIVTDSAKTELKSGYSYHKESLQQEIYQIGAKIERTVSAKVYQSFGLFIADSFQYRFFQTDHLLVDIQDANRCISVSNLLFPFHFFW